MAGMESSSGFSRRAVDLDRGARAATLTPGDAQVSTGLDRTSDQVTGKWSVDERSTYAGVPGTSDHELLHPRETPGLNVSGDTSSAHGSFRRQRGSPRAAGSRPPRSSSRWCTSRAATGVPGPVGWFERVELIEWRLERVGQSQGSAAGYRFGCRVAADRPERSRRRTRWEAASSPGFARSSAPRSAPTVPSRR